MSFPPFAEFFKALHDRPPFPWQRMLAEQVSGGGWPSAIDLPTASGKTACIDVAIYTLAAQAHLPAAERLAPRRVWFVVDRRIVVDEAFDRAERIAADLRDAQEGPLKIVADALRTLAGSKRPLAVGRLRGGVIRDDGWARLPAQPAVLTSTVDQLGSRLLFRGYGFSDSLAPIHAGLAANDSLIILDEGHCAKPFGQTLRAIEDYRHPRWAEQPLPAPFAFTMMSATLGAEAAELPRAIFPAPDQRASALDHPDLEERRNASKPAILIELKFSTRSGHDPLIAEAARHAVEFTNAGKQRVAVMVNRVATAEHIFQLLKDKHGTQADIQLLTGRMRPLDKDTLIAGLSAKLKAGKETEPLERPIILVTTQCLEVGADYCFDALVTECASLDALRQRFGRLDRLGKLRLSPAVILARTGDVKELRGSLPVDPIYGSALATTWAWLQAQSPEGEGPKQIDFGIAALEPMLPTGEALTKLLANSEDAPVLLPAHLDMLCQTAPEPDPQPAIDLFLHGKGRRSTDVSVVWRCDLLEGKTEDEWLEAVALLPPLSTEALQVPLHRFKAWLTQPNSADDTGDVEGTLPDADASTDAEGRSKLSSRGPFVIWRGRGSRREHGRERPNSYVTPFVDKLKPGDRVILPARLGMEGLGQRPESSEGIGVGLLDLAELAASRSRRWLSLRLNAATLAPWRQRPEVAAFLDWMNANQEDYQDDELREELDALLEGLRQPAVSPDAEKEPPPPVPEWFTETLDAYLNSRARRKSTLHPAGGWLLTAPNPRWKTGQLDAHEEAIEDEGDLSSRFSGDGEAVTLEQHTRDVVTAATRFASACLPPEFTPTFGYAAAAHDLGKADPRFQRLLHNGDEPATEAALASGQLLAKSERLSLSRAQQARVREAADLPKAFRHEALSWQVMAHLEAPGDADATLARHLVAAHHGHARPLHPEATERADAPPPTLDLRPLGIPLCLDGNARQGLTPPHRLDSGIAEDFWQLTRRYGWWGLAHLEATFRLADWYASEFPASATRDAPGLASLRPANATRSAAPAATHEIVLTGLDGANPLGFLAALGVLNALEQAWPAVPLRMGWKLDRGGWRPFLTSPDVLEPDDLAEQLLRSALNLDLMFPPALLEEAPEYGPKNKKGEASWRDKLMFEEKCFRRHLLTAVADASARQRTRIDWLAAWAGETGASEKNPVAQRTRFDFTAGQQAFIGMVRELRETIALDDIRQALFGPWAYRAGTVSMRWDPLDEKRQYAVQAFDPTNAAANPGLAEPGANFLATEGLRSFPFAPDRSASQPGFAGYGDNRTFSWRLWTAPLGVAQVRNGHSTKPNSRKVDHTDDSGPQFTSAIVMPSGRYRCFTPPQAKTS